MSMAGSAGCSVSLGSQGKNTLSRSLSNPRWWHVTCSVWSAAVSSAQTHVHISSHPASCILVDYAVPGFTLRRTFTRRRALLRPEQKRRGDGIMLSLLPSYVHRSSLMIILNEYLIYPQTAQNSTECGIFYKRVIFFNDGLVD